MSSLYLYSRIASAQLIAESEEPLNNPQIYTKSGEPVECRLTDVTEANGKSVIF
jgi:hypothetical protein